MKNQKEGFRKFSSMYVDCLASKYKNNASIDIIINYGLNYIKMYPKAKVLDDIASCINYLQIVKGLNAPVYKS